MARQLRIGARLIPADDDCYVIAEIGHNHQGRLETARQLFKAAKECGVTAVKLQKRHNATLYTKALYNQEYDNENSFGPTYGAHREALEFDRAQYTELKAYADELDLTFFATAFDEASADFLAALDMPAYKIASGDLTNLPLLTHVAGIRKPMIVSTGGATFDDVRRAYDAVMPINRQLCLLQCTASYPVEPEDMNLRVISTYRDAFPEVVVGLSDHQNGIAMADAAYLLGARVVEKHFTLNRAWKGSDHAFSLEPEGMRKLVRDLHRVRVALGDGLKRALPSEAGPLRKMSKSLVAMTDLAAGQVVTRTDVAIKSPGGGLPPYELGRVVGRTVRRPLGTDSPFRFEDLE